MASVSEIYKTVSQLLLPKLGIIFYKVYFIILYDVMKASNWPRWLKWKNEDWTILWGAVKYSASPFTKSAE